jgi:cell division protein FtsB
MSRKLHSPSLPIIRLLAIFTITFSIFLVIDISRRATSTFHAIREKDEVNQEITIEMARQEQLKTQLAYVAGDDYIDEAARKQLKWAKPNETVMVILLLKSSSELSLSDSMVPSSGKAADSPWQAWQQLIFGAP